MIDMVKVKSFEECKDILPEEFHDEWKDLFGKTFKRTHADDPYDHWRVWDMETGKRYTLSKELCEIVE